MGFLFLEEFYDFTLFYEENGFGGILIWSFLGACSGFHVGSLRRGDNMCVSYVRLGEFKGTLLYM
jgi:hypothetical protein